MIVLSTMKLVIISNFPPYKCGIAQYTRYLARAINKTGEFEVHIVSEGGENDPGNGYTVHNTYSRKTNFKQDILNKVKDLEPDIVHFQHAYVLFPNTEVFLDLFTEVSKIAKKTFVTLHTADVGVTNRFNWEVFYRTLLDHGHIIVHNDMCLQSIKHYNLPTEKVSVIPHGTEILQLPPKNVSRKNLDIEEDSFVFLILGFIHLFKNHHTVIAAYRMLKRKKKVKLLIAGVADRHTWYNRLYLFGCKVLSFLSPNIIWHNKFIEDDELPYYLSSSDVLLMPYWQNYPSASGIFHLAIGAKLPVLCSDSVKFSEVKKLFKDGSFSFVPTLSISKWKNAMQSIMESDDELSYVKETLFKYGKETSWKNIAEKHIEFFSR